MLRADPAVTSALSQVETNAALARHVREGALAGDSVVSLRGSIDAFIEDVVVVDADREVNAIAAQLVHRHLLRTIDAIHLASALELQPDHEADVTFACWDRRLWNAAATAGFTMLPSDPP